MEEKGNKKIKVIIIVLFIIILLAGIGLYYVYAKKDNNIKYYTLEEVRTFVKEFPYAVTLKEGYDYEKYWNTYKFQTVNDYLDIDVDAQVEARGDNLSKGKDIHGKTYGDYKKMGPEYVGKMLGLTVDEIDRMDKSFFHPSYNDIIGYYIIDGNEFKDAYIKLHGNDNIFDNSIVLECGYSSSSKDLNKYIYDKNIHKIIVKSSIKPIQNDHYIEIINEKEKNKEYIFEFVDITLNYDYKIDKFVFEGYNIAIDKDSTEEEIRKVIRENKDKLKKYKVIFNKTKKGYTYKSVSESI